MKHQEHQDTKEAPRKALDAFTESVAEQLVDAAIEVHRALGPGLLESIYERCLAHELKLRGLECISQKQVAVVDKDLRFEEALRFDLLVDG